MGNIEVTRRLAPKSATHYMHFYNLMIRDYFKFGWKFNWRKLKKEEVILISLQGDSIWDDATNKYPNLKSSDLRKL